MNRYTLLVLVAALASAPSLVAQSGPRSSDERLWRAARDGHVYVAREALDAGASCDTVVEGRTPLDVASAHGRLEIVELLLERGAHVDATSEDGWTALATAVECDERDVAMRLLAAGADATLAPRYEGSPLHLAARSGALELIRALLEAEPSLIAGPIDMYGRSALGVAVAEGQRATAELLLDRGADLEAASSAGATSLAIAAGLGRDACAALLIEAGARLDHADARGRTALHHAARAGHPLLLRRLVEAGAASYADRHGWTPLHFAAAFGHADCVDELLRDAQLEAPTATGKTPLHLAAMRGDHDVVRRLIQAGARVGLSDAARWTPLDSLAVHARRFERRPQHAHEVPDGEGERVLLRIRRWSPPLLDDVLLQVAQDGWVSTQESGRTTVHGRLDAAKLAVVLDEFAELGLPAIQRDAREAYYHTPMLVVATAGPRGRSEFVIDDDAGLAGRDDGSVSLDEVELGCTLDLVRAWARHLCDYTAVRSDEKR